MTLAWLVLSACGDDGSSEPGDGSPRPLDAGADGAIDDDASFDGRDAACTVPAEEAVEVMSALHVVGDVVYPNPPPAGGNHNACWGPWGVHESELADERFVHNLEHGGVVFLHNCAEGCPDEVNALTQIVRTRPLTIVTPYAALPTRFGIVAWGYRLLSDCFDREAFESFYFAHRDQAPESVSAEPPAACP